MILFTCLQIRSWIFPKCTNTFPKTRKRVHRTSTEKEEKAEVLSIWSVRQRRTAGNVWLARSCWDGPYTALELVTSPFLPWRQLGRSKVVGIMVLDDTFCFLNYRKQDYLQLSTASGSWMPVWINWQFQLICLKIVVIMQCFCPFTSLFFGLPVCLLHIGP